MQSIKTIFHNRSEAGQMLAEKLAALADRKDVLVLALPRGGVPIGFEIAQKLHLPLDVFIVRKLGVPGHPELAMGALATGGIRVLNQEVIEGLGISQLTIDAVVADGMIELSRSESLYRGHGASPILEGKTIILADDGVATGSTVYAAIRAITKQRPAKIVVAIPTAERSSLNFLKTKVAEVICLASPEHFLAVGDSYEDFRQMTDEDVTSLLTVAELKPALA